MIEQTNIPLENKDTKKIKYTLHLDGRTWWKSEYDSRGNEIYYEDCDVFWFKKVFDSRGNLIYYETSEGYISDDR